MTQWRVIFQLIPDKFSESGANDSAQCWQWCKYQLVAVIIRITMLVYEPIPSSVIRYVEGKVAVKPSIHSLQQSLFLPLSVVKIMNTKSRNLTNGRLDEGYLLSTTMQLEY